MKSLKPIFLFCFLYFFFAVSAKAQHNNPAFHVIAFFTAKEDLAHISFVHEANHGLIP